MCLSDAAPGYQYLLMLLWLFSLMKSLLDNKSIIPYSFKQLFAAAPWCVCPFFDFFFFFFNCKWILNSGGYSVREQSVWVVWQGGVFWSLFSCSHNPPTQPPLEGGRALCWGNTAVWSLTSKERQHSAKRGGIGKTKLHIKWCIYYSGAWMSFIIKGKSSTQINSFEL